MSLQLVDDEQVLEAALSLLDQLEDEEVDALPQAPSKKKRRTRGYNPNRARESQQQELLALREQVPQLEDHLQSLKGERSAVRKGTNITEMWKKLAMHERKSRVNAEQENRRLRELVRENAEVSTCNVQQLLQTRQEPIEILADQRPEPWPWLYRRRYAIPVDPRDGSIFREMAASIDVVHRQVLQVYNSGSNPDRDFGAAQFFTSGKAHCRAFADKILPYDVSSAGDAAWQFFAHSFRHSTTRFYHTDPRTSSGLVSDDTVAEIFGEEHRFGQVLLDLKVKQIVRRYVAADRVVIVWRASLRPSKFKTETLSDIVYDEKGALVIETFASRTQSSVNETASVVHTWQTVTPGISEDALGVQSDLVQELTGFVLNSCRPGRAVQSMETNLRAQAMQSVPG